RQPGRCGTQTVSATPTPPSGGSSDGVADIAQTWAAQVSALTYLCADEMDQDGRLSGTVDPAPGRGAVRGAVRARRRLPGRCRACRGGLRRPGGPRPDRDAAAHPAVAIHRPGVGGRGNPAGQHRPWRLAVIV